MRRSSMTISPMTSSATLRVFEKGALKTGMPACRGSSRSTWFVPTLKQPTAISLFAAARTFGRQLRPGADAEQVDALQRFDQMSLVEGRLEMCQVGVAGAPDQLDSAVVHSLEQKNADLVFLKREHLAHVSSICRAPML